MKRVFGTIEYLVIAAVAGFALIVGVYALPKARMVNNINHSYELLKHEGNYRYWAADLPGTQSDNFSDSLMEDIAINPGTGNILYDAMINCYVGWQDTAESGEWLLRVAGGQPFYEGYEQVVYGRYWHGYLLWMKPLLLMFSVPEMRLINMGVQLILLVWAMILLHRELGLRGCVVMGAGLLALNPISVAMTFHFSDIYCNVLISTIVMCTFRRWFTQNDDWWKVFLWIGIGTAYFDLMTYPLVSLGFPLVLYFMLRQHSFLKSVLRLVEYSFNWVVGYAGMWVLKWLIGSAFTGYDLVSDGLGAVGLRSSGEVANIDMSYGHVLSENAGAMFTKPVIACLVLIAVASVIGVIVGKCEFHVRRTSIAPLFLTALYPFIWYFVIRNHSIVHVWFAHRVLAISVAAFAALVSCFVRRREGASSIHVRKTETSSHPDNDKGALRVVEPEVMAPLDAEVVER